MENPDIVGIVNEVAQWIIATILTFLKLFKKDKS